MNHFCWFYLQNLTLRNCFKLRLKRKNKNAALRSKEGPLSQPVAYPVNHVVLDAIFCKVVIIIPVFLMRKLKPRKVKYFFHVIQLLCIRTGVPSHICFQSVHFYTTSWTHWTSWLGFSSLLFGTNIRPCQSPNFPRFYVPLTHYRSNSSTDQINDLFQSLENHEVLYQCKEIFFRRFWNEIVY